MNLTAKDNFLYFLGSKWGINSKEKQIKNPEFWQVDTFIAQRHILADLNISEGVYLLSTPCEDQYF